MPDPKDPMKDDPKVPLKEPGKVPDAKKSVPSPEPKDADKAAAFPTSSTTAPAARPDAGDAVTPIPDLPKGTRVCHEGERAVPGLRRYRVRAIDADRPIGQYILAPDRATAENCYLIHERFAELTDKDRPKLRVEELPD